MFYYNLLDKNSKIILSNLTKDLENKFKKCLKNEIISHRGIKCKHGKISNPTIGEAYILTSNIDEINSPRIFKDKLNLYLNLISEIQTIKDEMINTILHDITRINGYCIQELYELIPQDNYREKTYSKQISNLKDHILSNINITAKGLFKINRDVLQLKTECSNLKYIFNKKIQIEKSKHDISKAIMPSLHVYMPLLREKGIKINIDDSSSKNIILNYEYLEGAMTPFLENCLKYILPDSDLHIYFGKTFDGFAVIFDMQSMSIKKDEKEKIFNSGYSGENSIKNKLNGKGLGITKIQESLIVNDAELRININVDKNKGKRYKTTQYERNVFQIVFLNQ